MQITVLAAGSRGDVQPLLALSKGLQHTGMRVRLAAPQDFSAFVRQHEIDFYPLRGSVQQIMASATGQNFMETGGANPIKALRAFRKMGAPVVLQMAQDALEACRGSQALVCLAVIAPFGRSIAEALRIPLINAEPTPLLPTRAFPAAGWPIQRNLGGLHNRLSGVIMLRMIGQWFLPYLNSFRQGLGMPAFRAADFQRVLASTPLLGAYSPEIIPSPADWPGQAHVSGYWFLDEQENWQPPPGLEAFLSASDPPVYIGFGSMGGRDPEGTAALAFEALTKSRQRAVLLTGWGGLRSMSPPEGVYMLESAPHRWLFRRVAAVVHHGGAGTTAEGLRAGVPAVIVPFIVDQPFWGARIAALGVGPPPIPRQKLTADRLAHAMRAAATDPQMKRRAEKLGAAIRQEDGVGNAVRIIRQYLGE